MSATTVNQRFKAWERNIRRSGLPSCVAIAEELDGMSRTERFQHYCALKENGGVQVTAHAQDDLLTALQAQAEQLAQQIEALQNRESGVQVVEDRPLRVRKPKATPAPAPSGPARASEKGIGRMQVFNTFIIGKKKLATKVGAQFDYVSTKHNTVSTWVVRQNMGTEGILAERIA